MIANLGAFADVQAGHPFRGTIHESPEGDAFAVQMRDVSPDGGVNWGGLVRTSLDGRKSPEWLRTGDVLFVARGARNYALNLQTVPVAAVCSQYFYLVRVRSAGLLPEFLAWQINRVPAQRYLAKNAEGTAQLSIRRGVLEALPVVVPPLDQQHRIVAFSEDAIRERHVLESLMRNREQQLDALALDLYSQQLDR